MSKHTPKKVSFLELMSYLVAADYANAKEVSKILTDFKEAVAIKDSKDITLFSQSVGGRITLERERKVGVVMEFTTLQNSLMEIAKVDKIVTVMRPSIQNNDFDLTDACIGIQYEGYSIIASHRAETTYRHTMDGEYEHSIHITLIPKDSQETLEADIYLFMPEEKWPVLEAATT